MKIIIGGITASIMLVVLIFTQNNTDSSQPKGSKRFWVKIIFGTDGKTATWDGTIQAKDGRVLQVVDWQFEARDKLNADAKSWEITTGVPPKGRVTFAEPQRGLLVEVVATAKTVVSVDSKQGAFQIEPMKLTPGRPTSVLDGRATVEPLGTAQLAANTTTDDDFASIAVDAKGRRHVLWISFDAESDKDRLLIRNVDSPESKPVQIGDSGEFSSPHLFRDPNGRFRVVYCSPGKNADWNVYLATQTDNGWKTQRVTTAKGSDFHLAAAQEKDGTLWLVWQSFRNGNGDIYAQCLRDGKWAARDITVATSPANEWQPAISVDAKGKAWIGYDSYENGNYDVFLTSVSFINGEYRRGQRIAVAQSPDFEAHASVLAGESGNVWVAYDAAGPNWGRDFHNIPTSVRGKYAEPLHASRRIELRYITNGVVHEPKDALPQILPPRPIQKIVRSPKTKPSRFYEYPQLARDGDGRMWLFFRQCRQGYAAHPPKGIHWMIYATTYTDDGWVEPIELPKSQGRQNQRVAFTVGADDKLQCAWADGSRFASVDRKYGVYYGTLPNIKSREAVALKPANVGKPGTPERTPPPPWTITKNGKTYRVYYGDMHRHTNISRCTPTIDGCLTDAHRYALDAAELDFLAITDHTRDVDPFSWHRTQQAADHFHIPDRYIPIYAYERSNGTPMGGHRNVFFLKRGWKVNPSDHWYMGRGLKPKDTNPFTSLYPWMKERGALTAAHTPAYSAGAMKGTWTYHDPQVEPVAEIFQAFRRSYERPDKGVAEQASLWYALKKGRKLGFIASSDHISTHSSYACIWATDKSREALFEGLRSRRTFAATDRIVLDVRIGDALMGEETKVAGDTVALKIRALGTAPIDEIQIIRSGQVLARLQPGRSEVRTEYVDRNPVAGGSYYYVRIHQRDGGRAWGSPIWVTR